MDIEKLVNDISYNNKNISLALISNTYDIIVYLFNKQRVNDFDTITAIIVNTINNDFDMTLPYVNQLNMYYGDFEVLKSAFIGRYYKRVIEHYTNI